MYGVSVQVHNVNVLSLGGDGGYDPATVPNSRHRAAEVECTAPRGYGATISSSRRHFPAVRLRVAARPSRALRRVYSCHYLLCDHEARLTRGRLRIPMPLSCLAALRRLAGLRFRIARAPYVGTDVVIFLPAAQLQCNCDQRHACEYQQAIQSDVGALRAHQRYSGCHAQQSCGSADCMSSCWGHENKV